MDDRGVISWVIDGITSGTTAAGLGRITPTGSWEVTVQIDVSRANRGSALAGAGLPIFADKAALPRSPLVLNTSRRCPRLVSLGRWLASRQRSARDPSETFPGRGVQPSIALALVSAPPALMAIFTAPSIGSLKGTSIRSRPFSRSEERR